MDEVQWKKRGRDNTEKVQKLGTKNLTLDDGSERRWGKHNGGNRAKHDTGTLECVLKDTCS